MIIGEIIFLCYFLKLQFKKKRTLNLHARTDDYKTTDKEK